MIINNYIIIDNKNKCNKYKKSIKTIKKEFKQKKILKLSKLFNNIQIKEKKKDLNNID
jgi:hypothetical protein